MSLLLATVMFGVAPVWAEARRYAVVVGVNRGLAEDRPLHFAERDASRVADTLVALGGVQPSDLILLDGTDADQLRYVLADVEDRLRREAVPGEGSSLVLYYSGHADGRALRLEGSELPLDELHTWVKEAPVDLRILVLDACGTGDILRKKGGTPAAPFPLTLPGEGLVEGLAVITAAAEGEDAQESDRLEGGVFTHHLLAALAGAADTSGDRRVSLQEAYRYAQTRTLATTSRAPVVQHPSYAFDLSGQADVTLTVLDSARRTGRLVLPDGGSYVILNLAETEMVAEVQMEANGVLALPAGKYRVRLRLPDRVYEAEVEVRTGEELRLTQNEMRFQPYGQSVRRGETADTYAAWGLTLGGGLGRALGEGLGNSLRGDVGVRSDLFGFSVSGRLSVAHADATNSFLSIDHDLLLGSVAAVRMVEVRRASIGIGIGGGVGGLRQQFDTTGVAPERRSVVGKVAPVARAEWAFAPRWVLGADASLDVWFLPGTTDTVTRVAPQVGADITWWLP